MRKLTQLLTTPKADTAFELSILAISAAITGVWVNMIGSSVATLLWLFWFDAAFAGFFAIFTISWSTTIAKHPHYLLDSLFSLAAKVVLIPVFTTQYALFLATFGVIIFLIFGLPSNIDPSGVFVIAGLATYQAVLFLGFVHARNKSNLGLSKITWLAYRRVGPGILAALIAALVLRPYNPVQALLVIVGLKAFVDAYSLLTNKLN